MWNEERTELTEISLFPQGCGASVPGKVALGASIACALAADAAGLGHAENGTSQWQAGDVCWQWSSLAP